MKVMYTKHQYDIVPTWEREHWFPETMNKILLEFLTNEDRKVLYTFFYSVIGAWKKLRDRCTVLTNTLK
jgi:hypothetical protein